jgi:hypothetical protein
MELTLREEYWIKFCMKLIPASPCIVKIIKHKKVELVGHSVHKINGSMGFFVKMKGGENYKT